MKKLTRRVTTANQGSRFGLGSSFLIVPLLALLACKGLPGKSDSGSSTTTTGAPAVGAPLALNWEQPYKLDATGSTANATFFATKEADKPPLKLNATFMNFAKGTKVTVGTETGTLGDGGFFSTLVDIKPAILKQSLDDLKGPIDLGLTVTIQAPGAAAVTTPMPKEDVKDSLRFALLKARDGLSFGDGDAAAAKPRAVAVISGYSDLEFIGGGKNLKEVDWVVIADDQPAPRLTKTCNFKEGPSALKVFDATAVALDRRTGAKLAEQVIKASDECPMFVMVSKEDNSAKATIDQKDVVAFARSALQKAK
jgi:hypothetical protein